MEYLGFSVTRNGIRTVNKKIRRHSKYDATNDKNSCAHVYRIIQLLLGNVGQTVALTTKPN